MRYVSVLALLLACPSGHEVVLDGSRDAPSTDAPSPDAPITDAPITDAPITDAPITDAPSTDAPSADAPSDCPEPPDDLCCCSGDVVHAPPRCVDGVWSCGALGQLWSGFDCVRSCGSACTSYCTTEDTCDPRHGYLPFLRDRACAVDAECVAAPHVVDCCGTLAVVGFRATDLRRFRQLADECARHLGECDCLPGPTTADDGSTGAPDAAHATCVEGRCRTRF